MKSKIVICLILIMLCLLVNSCQKTKSKFEKGNGTQGSPYVIETFDDLLMISDTDKFTFYKLEHDIYNQNNYIIDASLGSLNGVIYGNGYTIYDIIIKNSKPYSHEDNHNFYAGLFDIMKSGSKISDLKLSNVNIDIQYFGFSHVGALVGYMETDTIVENSEISGIMNVNISDGSVGGIAGFGETIKTADTKIHMNVTSKLYSLCVGGIAGTINLLIDHGHSSGEINLNGGNDPMLNYNHHLVGGISGKVYGDIQESNNSGKITVIVDYWNSSMNISVDGIAGSTCGIIKYCISTGIISLSSNNIIYAGSLVGISLLDSHVSRSIALTEIVIQKTINEKSSFGSCIGYTLSKDNVEMLYYSNDLRLYQAVGNFQDNDMHYIENYPYAYYLCGEKLDYIDEKFHFHIGELPYIENKILY